MGRIKKNEMPMWARAGHRRPTTRREFLSYGLIPFAASALVPGALGLLVGGPKAAADTSACASAADMPAFITLNLSGGGSLASNFVPRNAAGELLPNYEVIGLGPNWSRDVETECGASGWAAGTSTSSGGSLASPMLAGIRSTGSQALANTAFIATWVKSMDDTGSNKFDASGMVYAAGLHGSKMANLGVDAVDGTGVNQMPAGLTPPQPLLVGGFSQIVNSIGYTSAIKTQLTTNQQLSLTKLVNSLNGWQTRKLAAIGSVSGVRQLLDCAGIKNTQVLQEGADGVDPLKSSSASALSSLWSLSGAADRSQARVFSAMVYNGVVGNAGPVALELGGYDYHDQTRTTGAARDREAGEMIGKILMTAHILGKKVFVYVSTDGAIVTNTSVTDPNTGTHPFAGDGSNANGGSFMFVYDPAGRPQTTGNHIGNYTNNSSNPIVDGTTVIGSDPELSTQAVFANYVKFATGKTDLFDTVLQRSALSAALDQVVKIG